MCGLLNEETWRVDQHFVETGWFEDFLWRGLGVGGVDWRWSIFERGFRLFRDGYYKLYFTTLIWLIISVQTEMLYHLLIFTYAFSLFHFMEKILKVLYFINSLFKGAMKLYFMHYLCVVIILFNTGLYKSAFSPDTFGKLFFCLSVLFALCWIWGTLHKHYSICIA